MQVEPVKRGRGSKAAVEEPAVEEPKGRGKKAAAKVYFITPT